MKSIVIPSPLLSTNNGFNKTKTSDAAKAQNEKLIIVCDECGEEFDAKDIKFSGIRKEPIMLNNTMVHLVYFLCPECHSVYVISIQDKKYYELADDLFKAEERLKRAFKRKDSQMAEEIEALVFKKKERLGNHVKRVKEKFPGTFTLTTVNGKDKIIYHEK